MPSFATLLKPLRRRRAGCSIMLSMLAGLGLGLAALAAETAAAPEGVDQGLTAFMRMIPLGAESKGAVIPSFDATGRRTSLIEADVIRRLDDERLYAEGLVVQIFNAEPKNNLRLDLHTAFYHIGKSVLRSLDRSRVTRPDFEIEGDTLIFDTATNQGRMTGDIEMVIFETESADGEATAGTPPATTDTTADTAPAPTPVPPTQAPSQTAAGSTDQPNQ